MQGQRGDEGEPGRDGRDVSFVLQFTFYLIYE